MKIIIISFLLLFTFKSILSSPDSTTYNLETPEKSWESLLSALKTGSEEEVKKVTTENGFKSLIQRISPYSETDPFGPSFKSWGEGWLNWKVRWLEKSEDKAKANAGPEIKEHVFEFIRTENGWKMYNWQPGK